MMRKFLAVALLVVASALVAGSAFAAMQKFDGFSIYVPNGWKVDKDDGTVGFIAPDESASLSVSIAADMDADEAVEEYAAAFSQELGGSAPKMAPSAANVYLFEFDNGNGVMSKAMVTGDGERVSMIVTTGESPEFDKMINSLE
jgi:hypothetical protein